MNKFHCYAEYVSGGGYIGRCREFPGIKFGPKKSRDLATAGARRMAKRALSMTGDAHAKPASAPTQVVSPVFSGKPKINRIAFVVDRSGSMQGVYRKAVEALRQNIETARQQAAATGQATFVTVISFDDDVNVIWHDAPIGTVRISDSDFLPRGSTALFDATGVAIERLGDAPTNGNDVAYLVVSITDGGENASRRWNTESLKALMGRVQATDRWTLTFLLPPGQKHGFCSRFGIPDGNVAEWEATAAGVQKYEAAVTTGTQAWYGTRAAGQTSMKSFYTTDMSAVKPEDVKAQLVDIRDQVKVWTVEKEQKVRDFVEGKTGQPFQKGTAFYALSKEEKEVQPYKQILIMEKGKNAVYGGPAARSILGLPNKTVKVIPGNHANWDIFVQSTSTNRELVRGTKLIYDPNAKIN